MKRFLIHKMILCSITVCISMSVMAQDIPEALFEKARSETVVRVIVRLNTPYQNTVDLESNDAFAQDAAIATAQSELVDAISNATFVEPIEGLPLTVLEVDADQLEQLRATSLVDAVIEDTLSEPTLVQSIPLIEANDVHSSGVTGAGQTVAVLDTGVDFNHPSMANKVVSQACYSTTSSANGGSQSLCPGGQSEALGGNSGADCSGAAGCGHGSHVAGIAAGNGGGVIGVAPEAKIIAVQVFSRFNSSSACQSSPAPCVLSYTSDQIRALQRVRGLAGSFTIASVNMSLGGNKFSSACDTDSRKPVIDQLRSLNIATIIASGNDGFSDGIGQPACISSAVAVGSTTKSDTLSGFSNSDELVDLLAPGSGIVSTRSGGGTTPKSGTSMATPAVAGAWALHRSRFPGDSVSTVLAKLKSEGQSITGRGITKPRIDLGYLVDESGGATESSPLAFGTILSSGSRYKGHGSWSSTYNPTYSRYEISINGENYHYLNYASIVTPAGDIRYCKTSSVDKKLLVYCYDNAGSNATSRFGFVIYKP